MEKQNNLEFELFDQTNISAQNSPEKRRQFLNYIWNYEKKILTIISFVIVGIIAFSLGVEKGKKLSTLSDNSRFGLELKNQTLAGNPNPAEPIAPNLMNRAQIEKKESPKNIIFKDPLGKSINTKRLSLNNVIEKTNVTKQQNLKSSAQNYTIQVASYQSKTQAQDEVEQLRKKGFAPLVLLKNNYTVVCVGKFSNRDTAKTLLSELKIKYQDCFIRRL